MHQELCPFCGTLREMDLTSYRTISFDGEGKEKHTTTVVCHCHHCGLFVRSEETKEEVPESA